MSKSGTLVIISACRSIDQHFLEWKPETYDSYAVTKYDPTKLVSNKFTSHEQSILGRLCNAFIKGLTEQVLPPRLVVIILDDDLITFLDTECDRHAESYPLTKMLEWLMTELTRVVAAYKDYLPEKSKKDNYPHFMWVQTPFHINFNNNEHQENFNKNLARSGKILHQHVTISP